ncbi:MAG TPA: hypothetical protein VGF55_20045 [Gemmataceae bacterium]|jgi:hypothetical protein
MATKTSPTATQQPPEPKFWVKYSPHHELPISSLASLAWHTLAVVLVVVVAWVVARGGSDEMPIETIQFGDVGSGGTAGTGKTPGVGTGGDPLVEAATADELPPDAQRPEEPLHDIKGLQITPKDLLNDVTLDKDSERELAKFTERGTKALEQLSKLDKRMRKALMAGDGTGTPGADGGSGGGDQGGTGNKPGSGTLNERTKRKLRWTITFNTQSGGDYLQQLHSLGAILAFRTPDGELKCVKDLMRRPVKPVGEDLQKLNRIFWIDDKRDSVEQLARALGLDFVPEQIVALFPYEFEKELLRKELAFRNRKESEIHQTRFQILMRGSGYEVVVTDQQYQ